MNITLITILITEIIVTVLILYCLISLNQSVNRCRQKIIAKNKKLKKTLSTLKDIFTLSNQYIELWKAEFLEKVEASGNLVGEAIMYYIMHKIFKKQYDSFKTGFSLIKLFW